MHAEVADGEEVPMMARLMTRLLLEAGAGPDIIEAIVQGWNYAYNDPPADPCDVAKLVLSESEKYFGLVGVSLTIH